MNNSYFSNQLPAYPKLIMNADDYGYSWERCQGILELIQSQSITSTTVIINAPEIHDKCNQLIKYCNNLKAKRDQNAVASGSRLAEQIRLHGTNDWKLSVGLHLNLTEFSSCQTSQPHQPACFIDSQTDTFKGKAYIYDNLSQIKNCSQFIEAEIRAQIEKFIRTFNFRPSHIDGHNHVHLIPEIAQSVCKVARLFGIYKVRMPIISHLHQTQDESQNKYNSKFLDLAGQARKIYDSYGFLYPDYFLGLDLMGKQLSIQKIEAKLKEINTELGRSNRNVIAEVMVHPGYKQQKQFKQYSTCPFSKNQDRQFQMNTLKSRQFEKLRPFFSSFHSLTKRESEKSILIYSKLLSCCGNLTTSLRLHRILTSYMKYKVYFLDVSEADELEEAQYLSSMINQLGIKFVIGVNLTRTAGIIFKAVNGTSGKIRYKVPYVLIVAGTDANMTICSGEKQTLQTINKSVIQSQSLISLSEEMKIRMETYLSANNICKEISLIKQSTLNEKIVTELKALQITNFTVAKPYIVFPTSFRKVKAVHHILPELNILIQKHDINVYVLGPIITESYYEETFPKMKKVVYLYCQPHQIYLQILRNSLALINCSESEGMSCSILEAFEEKIPVIARKNEGNCQLVVDGETGFLYQSGDDFIKKFENLLSNYQQIKQKVCNSAFSKLREHFSYEEQCQLYKKVMDSHFEPHLYSLKVAPNIQSSSNELIEMWISSLKNVHPVSPVNLKIFNKFFEKDDSEINPCYKYIGKMLADSSEEEKCINILDIGCGNGIFTIFFMMKTMVYFQHSEEKIKINLTFLDIHTDSLRNLKVNLRTFDQFYQSWKGSQVVLSGITIMQSDMFQQLKLSGLENFDIILANMPQTPFKNPQSRLDKNGGSDGFKLTTILLQNYRNYLRNQASFLVMLYSHMLNETKFRQVLHSNGSKIEWVSGTEVHRIKREDYEKMEERLAYMIEENMKNGRSGIQLEGETFLVPADLRIIKPQ